MKITEYSAQKHKILLILKIARQSKEFHLFLLALELLNVSNTYHDKEAGILLSSSLRVVNAFGVVPSKSRVFQNFKPKGETSFTLARFSL